MPDTTTKSLFTGLFFGASDLKEKTGWDEAVIRDYLSMLENLIKTADTLDDERDKKIEETPTSLTTGVLIAPSGGFLASTGVSLTDIESRAFFLARIY